MEGTMKRKFVYVAVAALLFCFGSSAQAQMADTGLFVGGGLSYAWEDFDTNDLEDAVGNVSIDDAWGFNLYAGYRFMKYFSLEANYNWYDSFQLDTKYYDSVDLDVWTLMLDAKFLYSLENGFVPYLRLGGGYMDAEVDNENDNDFAWNIGIGVDYYFTPEISMGLDGKYVIGTGDVDDINYFTGSVLVGFHF